jgi:hypothetical protein
MSSELLVACTVSPVCLCPRHRNMFCSVFAVLCYIVCFVCVCVFHFACSPCGQPELCTMLPGSEFVAMLFLVAYVSVDELYGVRRVKGVG